MLTIKNIEVLTDFVSIKISNAASVATARPDEQLIDLICSSSNLMDERDDIVAYINSLPVGQSLNEKEIREGYQSERKTPPFREGM